MVIANVMAIAKVKVAITTAATAKDGTIVVVVVVITGIASAFATSNEVFAMASSTR